MLRRPPNQGMSPTRRHPGFRRGRCPLVSLLLAVVTAVVAPAWVGSPWAGNLTSIAGSQARPSVALVSVAPVQAHLTSVGTSATAPVVKQDRNPVRVAQRHARGDHLSHPFAVTRSTALAVPQVVEARSASGMSSQGSTPPASRSSRGPPALSA